MIRILKETILRWSKLRGKDFARRLRTAGIPEQNSLSFAPEVWAELAHQYHLPDYGAKAVPPCPTRSCQR